MAKQTCNFWEEKDVRIPKGYSVSPKGVYFQDGKDSDEIRLSTKPLVVLEFIRDYGTEENWQSTLVFINSDGKHKQVRVKLSQLRDREITRILIDSGFHILPGEEKRIQDYLAHFAPKRRSTAYSSLGYMEAEDGRNLFALPDSVLGTVKGESFVYDNDSPVGSNIGVSGDLETWKSEVAEICKGNPYLVFALATAFASPLLAPLEAETGGFHFFGASSRGKTTMLQVAASVWGNGAFTSNAKDSYIKTWSTTINAIEGVAAAHNDLLLPFDELGQCESKDFEKLIYNIASGQGKSRMTKTGSMQKRASWRLLVLSSGEISIRDKIRENRTEPKAGQLIRFLDIPVHDDIVVSTNGVSDQKFVNNLKIACASNYGHAGQEYLDNLIKKLNGDNLDNTMEYLENQFNMFRTELLNGTKMSPERMRIIDRFTLVAVAGHLAFHFLDIDIDKKELLDSVRAVYKAWAKENSLLSEAEKAVFAIREAIKEKQASFTAAFGDKTNNLLGYNFIYKGKNKFGGKEVYAFTNEGFRAVTKNANIRSVCQELIRHDVLVRNNKDKDDIFKPKAKLKIPGADRQMYFYTVTVDILGLNLTEDEHEEAVIPKKKEVHPE